MRQRSSAPATDYSGYFLVAILLGIVLVVLGITMAVAQSSSRPQRVVERQATTAASTLFKALEFAKSADRLGFRRMEPFRDG